MESSRQCNEVLYPEERQEGFDLDHTYLPAWLKHLLCLAKHGLVAAVGGMILGFFPEALMSRMYHSKLLDPYSPMIALIAFLLGYFVSVRICKGRDGTLVWTIGLLWLTLGAYDTASNWSAGWSPESTRLSYTLVNLFGPPPACSGTECLGELFFTTPFAACVAYSLGAYIRWFRHSRSVDLSHPQR